MARPAKPLPQVMMDGVACIDLSGFTGWHVERLLSDVVGVEAEWSEARLVDFMFARSALPAQRRAWQLGQRRRALQRQLHSLLDGEVGGADVVEMVVDYTEPTPSELSLSWRPELLPERAKELKTRRDAGPQSSAFQRWQAVQRQRWREGEQQLAQEYAQLSPGEQRQLDDLSAADRLRYLNQEVLATLLDQPHQGPLPWTPWLIPRHRSALDFLHGQTQRGKKTRRDGAPVIPFLQSLLSWLPFPRRLPSTPARPSEDEASGWTQWHALGDEQRLPFEREEERHRRQQFAALQRRHAQWRQQLGHKPPDVRDSRLGGLPYLAEGDEWPSAESMRAPDEQNNFVLQLRLSQLPDDLGYAHALPGRPLSDQLVQVFGGGLAAYDGNAVARLVDCSRPARRGVAAPAGTDVYPAQFIVGWSGGVRSFPHHDHWREASVRVPVTAPLQRWSDDLFAFSWGEDIGKYAPTVDDKVGGWPGSRERHKPICPLCRRPIEQLLQVNSRTIGFEVYSCSAPLVVSQCPEHKEQLRCDVPMEID
jgi:hypothetical protein